MNLTLQVWRQKDAGSPGAFVTYQATDVDAHMSFLEMLDVVNEELVRKGDDPIVEEYTRSSSAYHRTSELWDDGLLDPVDTRNALAIAIACSLNTPIPDPSYGVFRF